jgi:hypothetical protein
MELAACLCASQLYAVSLLQACRTAIASLCLSSSSHEAKQSLDCAAMPHAVDLPYCAPTKALLTISLASLSPLRCRPFDLEGFTQQQVSRDAREHIMAHTEINASEDAID